MLTGPASSLADFDVFFSWGIGASGAKEWVVKLSADCANATDVKTAIVMAVIELHAVTLSPATRLNVGVWRVGCGFMVLG